MLTNSSLGSVFFALEVKAFVIISILASAADLLIQSIKHISQEPWLGIMK